MGRKEVEKTDEITKEFLVGIINFIEKSLDDVKTHGDAKLLTILADTLKECIEFYE